jgi:hypothetical protein
VFLLTQKFCLILFSKTDSRTHCPALTQTDLTSIFDSRARDKHNFPLVIYHHITADNLETLTCLAWNQNPQPTSIDVQIANSAIFKKAICS